jgi:hypothetical protein
VEENLTTLLSIIFKKEKVFSITTLLHQMVCHSSLREKKTVLIKIKKSTVTIQFAMLKRYNKSPEEHEGSEIYV